MAIGIMYNDPADLRNHDPNEYLLFRLYNPDGSYLGLGHVNIKANTWELDTLAGVEDLRAWVLYNEVKVSRTIFLSPGEMTTHIAGLKSLSA